VSPNNASLRWKAAALLLVCFLGGMVVGVALDRITLVRQHRMLPKGGLQFASKRIAARLDRELELTDQQRAAIDRILSGRGERVEQVWKSVRPAVRAEMERTDAEIEAVLNPEQRERFREIRERWRRRAQRFTGEDVSPATP
jgi:Spy/CpxP family protein refolding chaperone